MKQAKVFLVPAPLYEGESADIPDWVQKKAASISFYFAENIRTTRRVLKLYDKAVIIDNISFEEMNHKQALNINKFKEWIKAGHEIGIMSEAGMPAMADPGAQLVAIAQEMGATIIPMTGPSSILLSLAGSGLNGQQFEFLGYLPIDNAARNKQLKIIEEKALKGITQIFIETPYRNSVLLQQILKTVHPQLMLCVAAELTAPQAFVRTLFIKDWTKLNIDLHKKPCIFLIGKRM